MAFNKNLKFMPNENGTVEVFWKNGAPLGNLIEVNEGQVMFRMRSDTTLWEANVLHAVSGVLRKLNGEGIFTKHHGEQLVDYPHRELYDYLVKIMDSDLRVEIIGDTLETLAGGSQEAIEALTVSILDWDENV